jgi:hypothetical protein
MASGLESTIISIVLSSRYRRRRTLGSHGQTAVLVQAGNSPVSSNKDIAVLVRLGDDGQISQRDELAAETLPKVKTIDRGLQDGVLLRDPASIVWQSIDVASVEGGVHLRRGRAVLANHDRGHLVAAALYDDAGRGGDLRQVEICVLRSVFGDLSAERDDVSDSHL